MQQMPKLIISLRRYVHVCTRIVSVATSRINALLEQVQPCDLRLHLSDPWDTNKIITAAPAAGVNVESQYHQPQHVRWTHPKLTGKV
jgi:hypothetical protein